MLLLFAAAPSADNTTNIDQIVIKFFEVWETDKTNICVVHLTKLENM